MTTTAERYEFHPPTNIGAIRSSIMQRIKQRHSKSNTSSITSSPSPLTPPSHCNEYEKLPYLHLDNGLPSPPIETCLYEEHQQDEKLPTEVVVDALLELSQDLEQPPSPVLSTSQKLNEPLESSEAIREKIRLLKEEKHKLFQAMKDLLSKPTSGDVAMETVPMETDTMTTNTTTTTIATATTTVTTKERSRSSSRDNKARPVIRSRSISHTEFNSNNRPISRYYERRSPPTSSRLYNNNNNSNYYPYNRNSYPIPPSPTQQQSLLNMPRRVINNNNNNNNNSSYVSSRPQLAVRSSSSTTFRLPSSRPDRY